MTNRLQLRGRALKDKKMEIMEADVMVDTGNVRKALSDVYEDINWAYLAKNYFGKSRSWLYHKFSGMNNGKPDDFSDVDREKLKGALYDIADRLRKTADTL
jgi:hypothetical protein